MKTTLKLYGAAYLDGIIYYFDGKVADTTITSIANANSFTWVNKNHEFTVHKTDRRAFLESDCDFYTELNGQRLSSHVLPQHVVEICRMIVTLRKIKGKLTISNKN